MFAQPCGHTKSLNCMLLNDEYCGVKISKNIKIPIEKINYVQRNKDKNDAYFSLETMQVSRWSLIFKVWKEKAVLTKISFKTKIKTFYRHTQPERIPGYPDYKKRF